MRCAALMRSVVHHFENGSFFRGLQTPSFGRKKMLALIVEESNRGVLGRDIVFHASKRHADLEVRRMDWMYATNSIFNPRRMPTSFPALVLVPLQGNQPNWYVVLLDKACMALTHSVKAKKIMSPLLLHHRKLFEINSKCRI